jgi:exonuclease III
MCSGISLCDALVCCSWNVRGLTDLKLFELILHMKRHDIDVLCIQETRKNDVAAFEEQGYLVLLSGSGTVDKTWAGVGIIVAPRCKHRIKSYKQISDRICSLKLKVAGGVLGVISAYAPHNLSPLDERFRFFAELGDSFRRCSANVGKFIFGDLNSRIGKQLPGEEHIVGQNSFGRMAVHQVEVPNRDLLFEFCESAGLLIANTFLPGGPEEKVTYMEPGSTYLGEVTEAGYNMLDLLLCDSAMLSKCSSLVSIRTAALGTDHYLVRAVLQFDPPHEVAEKCTKPDLAALVDPVNKRIFADTFRSLVETSPTYESTLSNRWEVAKAAMKTASCSLPPKEGKANHPWISKETLDLITLRRQARAQNDYRNEQRLHKEVRKASKIDRTK